jgi:hypothetical protein
MTRVLVGAKLAIGNAGKYRYTEHVTYRSLQHR